MPVPVPAPGMGSHMRLSGACAVFDFCTSIIKRGHKKVINSISIPQVLDVSAKHVSHNDNNSNDNERRNGPPFLFISIRAFWQCSRLTFHTVNISAIPCAVSSVYTNLLLHDGDIKVITMLLLLEIHFYVLRQAQCCSHHDAGRSTWRPLNYPQPQQLLYSRRVNLS